MPDRIGAWSRVWNIGAVRKTFLLIVLALVWEGYARWLNNPLLFPTFVDTVKAFFAAIASGELPKAASYTIQMLLKGYVAGLLIAALLTALASMTRIGADLLEMLTSMFNPLLRRPLTLEFYRKHGYQETGRGFYGEVETVQFSKTLDERVRERAA